MKCVEKHAPSSALPVKSNVLIGPKFRLDKKSLDKKSLDQNFLKSDLSVA